MQTGSPLLKKDLSVLRILLAEGDQINLAVIKHLLKKSGCSFDLAVNDGEILKKLRQGEYDLAIIDLDHKEINAYDTTVKIRSEQAMPIPILGITNNSSAADFEKFAVAGVNNYMLRPVKLNDLTAAINTIVEVQQSTMQSAPPVQAVINLKMLYATCGNSETVNNILRLFVAQTPGNMDHLDEFVKTKNWEGLKNLSHNMKSIYSLIGLPDTKRCFDEMEKDCTTGNVDVEKFQNYLDSIKTINIKVINEMTKILEENSNPVTH